MLILGFELLPEPHEVAVAPADEELLGAELRQLGPRLYLEVDECVRERARRAVLLRVGDGDREQSLAAVLLPVRRGSPIAMGRASLHAQHAHSRPGCVELRYPPTVRSTPRHEMRRG